MMRARTVIAVVVGFAIAGTALVTCARADAISNESAGSIAQLLASGWQIAGYASNSDDRSTFILFKKTGEAYLVQCLAGYDARGRRESSRIAIGCNDRYSGQS